LVIDNLKVISFQKKGVMENLVFRIRIRPYRFILLYGFIVLGIFVGAGLAMTKESFILSVILGLTFIIFFLLVKRTEVQMDQSFLRYRHLGFIRGEIPIQSIRSIRIGGYLWAGLRLAFGNKGLLIQYGRYDEILIDPEPASEFIEELVKRNPSIQIIR